MSSDIRSITYEGAALVTQSDSADDPVGPFAAFEASSGSGLVKITTLTGDVVTLYATQGLIVPVAIKRVWSTGTAASLSIVGFRAVPYKQAINPGTGTVY